MKSLRFASSLIALAAFSAAAAETSTTTAKFSDPGKPGTLKVAIGRGDLRIQGADTKEIAVESEAAAVTPAARKDGLRVLTASSAFALNEKDNVVTLDAMSDSWNGQASDFRITVPRDTSVVIANALGGDITCRGVTGDIEIKSLNGEVRLDDLAGAALVETTNGAINATVREMGTKSLSFMSTNGAVVLHLPATAKANVRLRTQNGAILTDFDEKALVTKVESLPRGTRYGMLSAEAREAFREAARAGAEAARRAAEAVREAAEAAREGAEADEGAHHDHTGRASAPRPPVPPIPPTPAIPPITGGKLVTGTLNGGGPEITVATMNGDVTLRHSK
jgi:hypothetical protein